MATLVKDLQIGDEIIVPGRSGDLLMIVRDVLPEERKVRISRPMAKQGGGLIGLSFFSSEFADLQNRVTLVR